MTPQQATAFEHPCFDPLECNHPRFARRLLRPRDDITTVLTANVGLE